MGKKHHEKKGEGTRPIRGSEGKKQRRCITEKEKEIEIKSSRKKKGEKRAGEKKAILVGKRNHRTS